MPLTNDGDADSKDNRVAIRQGLRQNLGQFAILIVVNAFVGAMIGLEQTVVPLIGKDLFGIESATIILSFIASFGLVKAVLNLYAGALAVSAKTNGVCVFANLRISGKVEVLLPVVTPSLYCSYASTSFAS